MEIYVVTPMLRTITLEVDCNETIESVKTRVGLEEISGAVQKLRYGGKDLEDGRTLAYYNILQYSTLNHSLSDLQIKRPSAGVAPAQTKKARLAMESGLSIRALTASLKAKLNDSALLQAKATAAPSDPMPEICAHPPPSLLTELEDLKRELATSRSKEKELEATISGQTQKCAFYEFQIVSLKAENKKTEVELSVAHNKEKELEAAISGLYKVISTTCSSYESQLFALKAENKETQQDLIIARNKEKKLEATKSRLAQKNEAFSAQCASSESQIVALENEIKRYNECMTVIHSQIIDVSRALDTWKERQSGSNPL